MLAGKHEKDSPGEITNFMAKMSLVMGFSLCDTGASFQSAWKSLRPVSTPESFLEFHLDSIGTGKSKKKTRSNSRRRSLFSVANLTIEELVSPEKKLKISSQDNDIEAHRIGNKYDFCLFIYNII